MSFRPAEFRDLVLTGPAPVFATISGAHLYGFESPDSDVDIRGVFSLNLSERLSLREETSTFESSFDQAGLEIDWVAHDIRKFAKLMTRRNGYVLEQLYSPLLVFDGGWLEELRDVGQGCMVRHLFHHYRGFIANKLKDVVAPAGTVKDMLYAYRVVLTGIHVLNSGLILAHLPSLLDLYPQTGVHDLMERKRHGDEHAALLPHDVVTHLPYLERLAADLEEAFLTSKLPEEVSTYDALDDLVIRICRAHAQ